MDGNAGFPRSGAALIAVFPRRHRHAPAYQLQDFQIQLRMSVR
jgi:hypothetical protein